MSNRSLAPMRGEPGERDEEILSVAQLDARLRSAVRAMGSVLVEGEVTNFRPNPNGHLYFTLKDEREDATIGCVMWRSDAQRGAGRERIVNGARVQVRAIADLYAPQGKLQLQVTRVTPAGLGDLLIKREELKRKLFAEGLFDQARKRRLPDAPRVVGVVTSGTGAAFQDIVKVARRRGAVRILLDSAAVQGDDAPRQLRRALLRLASLREVDVIILGRGGGSAEDLAAFDDEELARALASCGKPVVAAVGHEVDWSIACLVADVRAATPSQAAELVVADETARRARMQEQLRLLGLAPRRAFADKRQKVDDLCGRLVAAMRAQLRQTSKGREQLHRRLEARHPRTRLAQLRGALGPLEVRLRGVIARRLDRRRATLAQLAQNLDAISPLAVLARGYAIALQRDEHGRMHALRDPREARIGAAIEVRLHEGTIDATVTGSRGRAEGGNG